MQDSGRTTHMRTASSEKASLVREGEVDEEEDEGEEEVEQEAVGVSRGERQQVSRVLLSPNQDSPTSFVSFLLVE